MKYYILSLHLMKYYFKNFIYKVLKIFYLIKSVRFNYSFRIIKIIFFVKGKKNRER